MTKSEVLPVAAAMARTALLCKAFAASTVPCLYPVPVTGLSPYGRVVLMRTLMPMFGVA
jgi:hypothetical protein